MNSFLNGKIGTQVFKNLEWLGWHLCIDILFQALRGYGKESSCPSTQGLVISLVSIAEV